MQALTDLLLPLFLALGCVWFVVDLAKKLRSPAPNEAPVPAPPSPPTVAVPAPASAADAVPSPAHSFSPRHPDSATAAAPVPSSGVIPAAHLAVIAATVHHLFRGRARVAGVHAVATGAPPAAADWAREGRRDIFTSHRLR